MSRALLKILRQRQIGMFIGMLKIIVGNLSPYANWMSLALVGVMSFYTTINPLFEQRGISLPFWMFCLVLGLIIVAMGIAEWVFMMPSFYRANNTQVWDAGGPFQDNIGAIRKENAELESKLDVTNTRLDGMEKMLKELLSTYDSKDA